MQAPTTTRVFLAIELGDAARTLLADQIHRLARELPSARWVQPESLHLTLAFLGEIDDEQLSAAKAASASAARSAAPFQLEVAGLGSFGPARAPRVIWAGVRGDLQALQHVQQRLARELEQRGFPREERMFSPHLTLARLRQPTPEADLSRIIEALRAPSQATAPIPVEHLSVMKSELARPNARYTRLATYALGSPASDTIH